MYTLEKNNTSPLCILCTLVSWTITLLVLTLVCTWYEESTQTPPPLFSGKDSPKYENLIIINLKHMGRFFDTIIDLDYWYHAIHLHARPTLIVTSFFYKHCMKAYRRLLIGTIRKCATRYLQGLGFHNVYVFSSQSPRQRTFVFVKHSLFKLL